MEEEEEKEEEEEVRRRDFESQVDLVLMHLK